MAVKTMAELRAEAEELTTRWNSATLDGKSEDVRKYDEDITKAVNEYTALSKRATFKALALTDDPMLSAVEMLVFPSIAKKDTKNKETGIVTREIIDTTKAINLRELNKAVEGGIGKDSNWVYLIEKLNYLLTAKRAIDLKIDPKSIDRYAMSDIAAAIQMGKTPTSNTGILRLVQTVVTAMLGEEYKVTSHDINYLNSIYCKKNKTALSVTCANHRYLTAYIAEVCHRIVTGKSYEIVYKQKKEK